MIKNDFVKKIEDAIVELKKGHLIIVADSENRESEGDMVGLAQFVTPQSVNTMVTSARGLLCVPMSEEYANRLQLLPMINNSTDKYGTAFTTSLDAKTTSTGISAYDRSRTIEQLARKTSGWNDFYHPGHVFPLVARRGGVIERGGHTEAAVDLAKIAGNIPVAYICEILKKDGTMARRKDLKRFSEEMDMPIITIDELIQYRYRKNIDVCSSIAKVNMPTKYGNFTLEAFSTVNEKEPTLLISKGDIDNQNPLLLRVHSECLTGDLFGSRRCDCGDQLHKALEMIEQSGQGAVLYLRQEGRGIGLANKLKAYHLQDNGLDTVEANLKLGFSADQRNYDLVASILKQKGINSVKLMTNNPDKINQIQNIGIKVVERVPLEIKPTKENKKYLQTKKDKLHHLLKEVE
ncbi:GTP cyclohydrolase II [Oenococcus sp. UCMA 17063]|nr:GTP cyclohydrolase II [Oenococcus sp. UCMA 17063]